MENKTPAQIVAEKLMNIQAEIKAPKGQTNDFGKYKYRSCEDILKAAKPLLQKNGLVLTITDELVEISGRVYVKATATVSDGIATIHTQAFAREPEDKKGSDQAQVTGASSSYARKYALGGLFALDDTKDPDTNEWREERENRQKTQKPAQKAQPAPAPAPTGPICSDCGRPLTDHGKWKVQTIANWSQEKLGAIVCWDCISTKYQRNDQEGNTNA